MEVPNISIEEYHYLQYLVFKYCEIPEVDLNVPFTYF